MPRTHAGYQCSPATNTVDQRPEPDIKPCTTTPRFQWEQAGMSKRSWARYRCEMRAPQVSVPQQATEVSSS